MAFPTNSDGKRIRDWRDLEEYGVHSLTGEACGIGIRLLCDLSPEGVTLMEQFLSIKMTEQNNSWNHSGSAGWKSIMMPRGLFKELVVFCLMQKDGFRWAAVVDWYEEGLGRARNVIKENHASVEQLAQLLLEKETLMAKSGFPARLRRM